MQNSLQQNQKCLDDVPCPDVFASIGIDFKFEYEKQESETVDAAMEKVKELTSRYAIKKLLDIAYDIDD